jgi:peroxiredoxin
LWCRRLACRHGESRRDARTTNRKVVCTQPLRVISRPDLLRPLRGKDAGQEHRSRRVWLRWTALGAAIIGLIAAGATWWNRAPKVEPIFELTGGEGAGPVREFALRDIRDRVHTAEEWDGRPAIVLFFLARECPVSNGYAPEMAHLYREYGPRGVLFFGIHSDPDVTALEAATHAREYGLSFPILLDLEQEVAQQAGVRVTPEAVVLLPDGQIIYHGRIDDRYAPAGQHRPAAEIHDLRIALEAVLADEMPVVTRTRAFGCPLPAKRKSMPRTETITFNRHVAPIFYRSCVRCHRPGEVGPFSLLTYHDALKRAEFVRDVTSDGRMPPWKPHPGAGVFLDAARLSAREKQVIQVWVDTGCKEGDPADLPAPPVFTDGWQLGQPDLILTMPEPYRLPASGPDVYQSFPIRFPLEREAIVTGVEFRPDNRRVVHHSRTYLDETGDARRRDNADAAAGFSGWFKETSGLDLPYPGIGAWTPGMTPRFAPEGVGRIIPVGSDFVLQIHYHPTGKPETDQSRIGLFVTKKSISKTMAGFTLCTEHIDIPPGAKRHKIILSTRMKADVHLYTVVPHAHYLCREFRLAATLPDGRVQPLLWITDWDLDWQDQYRYAKPVRLPKGTIVTLAAYYDNSEDNPRNPHTPPRRVRYGVGTNDEMCACHLEFLPDDMSGYAAYKQKSPFGL